MVLLDHPLPHFVEDVFASNESGVVLMRPEMELFLLMLQKVDLSFLATPIDVSVVQLDKEVLAHSPHLSYVAIEPVEGQ